MKVTKHNYIFSLHLLYELLPQKTELIHLTQLTTITNPKATTKTFPKPKTTCFNNKHLNHHHISSAMPHTATKIPSSAPTLLNPCSHHMHFHLTIYFSAIKKRRVQINQSEHFDSQAWIINIRQWLRS